MSGEKRIVNNDFWIDFINKKPEIAGYAWKENEENRLTKESLNEIYTLKKD